VDLDLGSSAGCKAMNVTTKVKEQHRKAKAEAKRLARLERRKAKREREPEARQNSEGRL
jgi:hypothetical protein